MCCIVGETSSCVALWENIFICCIVGETTSCVALWENIFMCCIVGETWKVLWYANVCEDTIIGLIQPKHNENGAVILKMEE